MGNVDRIERIIPATLPIQSAHSVARREDGAAKHHGEERQQEDTVELSGEEIVAEEPLELIPESEIVGSLDIAV